MPNLSLPVVTTGTPSVNSLLPSVCQRPQSNHAISPQGTQEGVLPRGIYDFRLPDTQDFFGDNSTPMREQSPDLNLLQAPNNPWSSGIDPTRAQGAHVTPHIVIDSGCCQDSDAVSPRSTSTDCNSYRGPRSPKIQHITRASSPNATCEVMNPRREYSKIQKKFQAPRRSEQRVHCGVVSISLRCTISVFNNGYHARNRSRDTDRA